MLKNNLVNNAAAWAPKTNAELCRNRTQEVVDLFVGIDGNTHVDACTGLGHNEVIAVHS